MSAHRMVTFRGVATTLASLAERYGVPYETVRARVDRLGWTLERALATPADRRFRKGGRPKRGEVRAVPKMHQHATSGQAFARWRAGGRDCTRYFGPWGTPAARESYRRFAAEWSAGQAEMGAADPPERIGLGKVVARWLRHAQAEYVKNGTATSEYALQQRAFTVVVELYGDTVAAEFDPGKFRVVRQAMIDKGTWCRKTINQQAGRVVTALGWAAGEGLIPPSVPAALREVRRLRAGKTAAVDRAKKPPVTEAAIEAIRPHLSPFPERAAKLAAMIRVQRLTGMRPGELCGLRPCDLDPSGDVWLYTVRPEVNKNAHRDRPQRYYLGPKVQAELTPYLTGEADAPAFGMKRNRYYAAINLACRRAGIPLWHPHQLRHALATEVAREVGTIEAAAGAIGDSPAVTAKHYVHVDPQERAKIEWARDRG